MHKIDAFARESQETHAGKTVVVYTEISDVTPRRARQKGRVRGRQTSPAGLRVPRAGSPPQLVHSSSAPSHTMHQDRALRGVLCKGTQLGGRWGRMCSP